MPENADLRIATAQEIADNLSFALQFDGRRRVHHAGNFMALITAERLVQHFELSGSVLRKPPAPAHSAGFHHEP